MWTRRISTVVVTSRINLGFRYHQAPCVSRSLGLNATSAMVQPWIPRRHDRSSHQQTSIAYFSVRRRRTNNRDGMRAPPPPSSSLQPESSDGTNSGEEMSDDKRQAAIRTGIHSVPMDFEPRAKRFLAKIHTAIQPLVPLNDNMIVTLGEDEPPDDDESPTELNESVVYGPFLLIDLGPVHGQYTLTADAMQGVILFQSPVSGQRVYAMHPNSGEWSCVEDGHNLEGILVRDLIRQIQGVPNL